MVKWEQRSVNLLNVSPEPGKRAEIGFPYRRVLFQSDMTTSLSHNPESQLDQGCDNALVILPRYLGHGVSAPRASGSLVGLQQNAGRNGAVACRHGDYSFVQ